MIQLNGQDYPLDAAVELPALLQQLGVEGRRLAVELNQQIVPRSQYLHTRIQPGDQLEIVEAIGGG